MLYHSKDLKEIDETKESMIPNSKSGSSFNYEDDDSKASNRVQVEEVLLTQNLIIHKFIGF